MKVHQTIGKHVHFLIPSDTGDVSGTGVIVHFQAKSEGLPGPLARKYYHLDPEDTETVQTRVKPADYDRLVVLDSFGKHTIISEKNFGHLKLG